MTSKRLDKYLYRLDEIETQARRQHGESTAKYLEFIIKSFLEYWRELQQLKPEDLQGRAWYTLEAFFDMKLKEIAACRLEMQWMIYEFDGFDLHNDSYECNYFPQKKYRYKARQQSLQTCMLEEKVHASEREVFTFPVLTNRK